MSFNINSIYRANLSMLTDLYQLTMAQGYWKSDMKDTEAVFHMFFRRNPFQGNYAVCAGLAYFVDYLKYFNIGHTELEFLRSLNGADGKPLFDEEFLVYLAKMEMDLTIDAIPEGQFVFAHEPIVRVRGPIIQCQIIETALLNIINFQTLIATKAHRVVRAANGGRVAEFGLRRAQGIDGALAASRASYIGGCSATSNVLAGQLFGIPVVGTHAHSWVMSFDSEEEAFEAYAKASPNNCTFLVDTYDTLNGVKNAIKQGKELVKDGFKLNAIRLDSGDLAALSIDARALLDEAGFTDTKIVASNDLDEYKIAELKEKGSRIDTWGVGTSMVTADDQPALGGVYKLGAIKKKDGWVNKIKLSSDPVKMTNPGVLDVLRHKYKYMGDVIVNDKCDLTDYSEYTSILEPVPQLKGSFHDRLRLVYENPSLESIRARREDAETLVGALGHLGTYPVNIHPDLAAEKERLSKSHG